MVWKKIPDAASSWAGNISPKTMYDAIRKKRLKAARIGAGRNLLVCEEFVDEWLKSSVRSDEREPADPRQLREAARR
jgi:excisionase family DNA binding protein